MGIMPIVWLQHRWMLYILILGGFLLWLVLRPSPAMAPGAAGSYAAVARAPSVMPDNNYFPLPMKALRPELIAAERNPFLPKVSSSPEQTPVVVAPLTHVAPEPYMPSLNAEFSGRIRSPSGEAIVFAKIDGQEVRLDPGSQLANGYQVMAVNAEFVEFSHPALKARQRMDLPPAPAFEVR